MEFHSIVNFGTFSKYLLTIRDMKAYCTCFQLRWCGVCSISRIILTFVRRVIVYYKINQIFTSCFQFPFFPKYHSYFFLLFVLIIFVNVWSLFFLFFFTYVVSFLYCHVCSFWWWKGQFCPACKQKCQRLARRGKGALRRFCGGNCFEVRGRWLNCCEL